MRSSILPLLEARELQLGDGFVGNALELRQLPDLALHERVHGVVKTAVGHVSVDRGLANLRLDVLDDDNLGARFQCALERAEYVAGTGVGVVEEDLAEEVDVGLGGLGLEEGVGLECDVVLGEFWILRDNIVRVFDDLR